MWEIVKNYKESVAYIYIYIQWTYLQTKKNEIMRFLGKWIELENIILS